MSRRVDWGRVAGYRGHAFVHRRSPNTTGAFCTTCIFRGSPFRTTQQTPPLPLATTFPANWVMVPQEEYGHGRKQFSFKRREPVSFSVCGRPGINLGAALRGDLENLDGLDDPVLHGASGAISCRFLVISFVSYFCTELTAFVYSSLVIQSTVVFFRYDFCVGFTFPHINREVPDPCVELENKTSASKTCQTCP